jgi:hypothetical protein
MDPSERQNTMAWVVQVWASFAVALGLTLAGTLMLPVDWWARGYLLMGELFLVGSTFTLAKTTRDEHEARLFRNRLAKAKSEKLLKEFEINN